MTSSFVGAAALVGGSAAWACIGAGMTVPFIDSPQPAGATPGSQVQISGGNWQGYSVQIQWDGPGEQLLAQVTPGLDGSFSRAVTIPSGATPGLYSVFAAQGATSSEPVRIEVLSADSSPQPATTQPTSEPAAGGNPTARTSAGSLNVGQADPVVAPEGSPDAPVADQSPAVPSASPSAGAPVRAASEALPRQATSAPRDAPSAPAAAAAPRAAASDHEESSTRVGSLSNDLWSGFDGPDRFSEAGGRLPSSSVRDDPPLPIVPAVMVAGLLSLFAGFALTEMRRRRAPARMGSN